MSGRTHQLIAITLIVALWMPLVIVPVSASSAAEAHGSPNSTASILGLAWAKLAKLTAGSAQDEEAAPPGMPSLERPRRQPETSKPLPSKEERKAKVASLSLTPEKDVTLEAGQQIIVAAIPKDSEGNPVHGLGAEWDSNQPDIVSVTTDGLATAKEVGKAHLTASAGNKRAMLSVTVIPAQPRQRGSAQQTASINTIGLRGRRLQSQALNSQKEDAATPEASARPKRSLSHGPRLSRMRAALASVPPVLDEDGRRYVSEVGAPPGQAEPGAATPPAAVGGTERPGTANFTFDVPLLSLPGRGLDVSLSLVYNSHLWNKKKVDSMTTLSFDVDQSWPAPGFSLGYGKLLWSNNSYMLIDGGGTRHPLKPTNGTGVNDATEWETTDGTFTKVIVTNGSYKALFADGTQTIYGAGADLALYPIRITDRHGNFINISYKGANGAGPRIDTIKDTLERTTTFNYEGGDLVSISVPPYLNEGGDRQVVRFYYSDLTVDPTGGGSFSGVTIPATSQNKTVRVISRVYFPGTQSGYAYFYSNPYGMIYRIEQRRTMTVSTMLATQMGSVVGEGVTAASTEYDYPTIPSALPDAPRYTRRTDDWAGRTTGASLPFYTFSVTEGTINLSIVTAPDGTTTETETYGSTNNGLSGLLKQITVKSASGALLSRTVFNWEYFLDESNPRIIRVLTTNDHLQTKGVVYTYDTDSYANNNVTKVSERDFTLDGTLSPVELRRTETTYEKGTAYLNRRLLRLPTSVKVFEGGSTVPSSFVEYKYDEGGEAALTQRAGLLMYTNPQSAQRGNLTKVIAYNDAAAPNINAASVNQTAYDITGNPVSLTLNCCQQKTITYSDAYKFAYPVSVTRGSAPDQLTTSSTYDFSTGLALTSTDENNQVTALSYYPDTLRLDTVYRPDASYTRYHYYDGLTADPDTTRPHSYVSVATSSGVGTVLWNYQFMDGRGAVARSFTNNTQANGWQTTDAEYDEMGRTKRTSSAYYSTGVGTAVPTVPQMWTSAEQYDGLGRVIRVRLPDSTLVQATYDGNQVTLTDQAGRQKRQVSDALGRVVRLDEPDAGGNLGDGSAAIQPTNYEYDALGHLTRVIQAGPGGVTQERKFKYDSLGHLTHERQVEAVATLDNNGARLSSGGLWTAVYKYNLHGLISDAYDARGLHTTFGYDGLNRIHQVSYSGESGTVRTPSLTYTYDQSHVGYFNKGRLTEVRTDAVNIQGVQAVPQTAQAYDYDLMGRVKNQQQTVGTDSYTLSYAYNMLGQLTSETYPSGRVINYEFDDGARLKKVANGSVGDYATSFAYKAHGGLESMTLGNGAVQSVSYNERLQPTQVKLTVAGAEKQRFNYQYGVVDLSTGTVDASKNTGQIARVEGWIDGVRQWQQRFAFDTLGRLDIASEHKGSSLELLSWKADYDFDRWGNRYQSGGQNQNLGYVPVTAADINTQTNRLTAQTTYDDAGNVTVDQKFRAQQFMYDGNGRQVWSGQINTSGEAKAVYDGLGQRVQTVEDGMARTMVYDINGQLVAEYGGQVVGTGGTHYLMTDVQSSARMVMAASGAIETRHDFLPYGEEIQSDTTLRTTAKGYTAVDSLRQRYAAMERDANGLDHALWRKYESKAGRWTTVDPYGGSMQIGDPQSFNRYSYVGNDPVNRIDPSGLHYLVDGVSLGVGGFRYGPDGVYAGYFGDPNILITRRWGIGENIINNDREAYYDWYSASFVSFIDWGFAGFGGPQKPKTPYIDEKILNECTQDYFGVTLNNFTPSSKGQDGSFTGTGPSYMPDNPHGAGYDDTFTVTNNVRRYSLNDLRTVNRNFTGKDNRVTGVTDPYNPKRNYTANDLKSPLEILKTQVHELGHSLDAITAIQYKDKGVEIGDKLETCVAKRGGFKFK